MNNTTTVRIGWLNNATVTRADGTTVSGYFTCHDSRGYVLTIGQGIECFDPSVVLIQNDGRGDFFPGKVAVTARSSRMR